MTKASTIILGSLTIPGQSQHLHAARAFVARALRDDCAHADTAVLLTSELVTNSLQHSNSRRDGGNITLTVIAFGGGIRVEVLDEGGPTIPSLRPVRAELPELVEGGRGLHLVETLSDRWSYAQGASGTVTWFELTEPPHE